MSSRADSNWTRPAKQQTKSRMTKNRSGGEQGVFSAQFPSGRPSTGKGGVLLYFNDIATVSSRWRAQNLFESLTFASKYMYRLASEIHQTDDFEQRLEGARPIHNTTAWSKTNES